MEQRPKIEAVIFDMDGLLIDSERVYSEAANVLLKPYGQTMSWDLKSKLMGRPQADAVRMLIEHTKIPLTPEEVIEKTHVLQDEMFRKVAIMPGALKLVQHLQANKIPIAIATGSQHRNLLLKTSHLPELIDCFPKDKIITGDSSLLKPGRGKPHPDIFHLAAQTLGIEDEEGWKKCLVFEDGVPGVHAALAASMSVLWVPDAGLKEHMEKTEGVQVKPTLELKSLEEFKPEEWGLPAY